MSDLYHALTWPELSYVAVDPRGRIIGYILSKMRVTNSFNKLQLIGDSGRKNQRTNRVDMSRPFQYYVRIADLDWLIG